MTPEQSDQKIKKLEADIVKLKSIISELTRRINFLERENGRRKNDVNQLARTKG